jgi:hypothetical protein
MHSPPEISAQSGAPSRSTRSKPPATISIDLDNLWAHLRVHGDAAWRSFPSYLELAVPRVIRFFSDRGLRPTVFVVGQDAELDANRGAFERLATTGWELGNHSFHHEPWLHQRSEESIDEELARAEEAIESATGRRPLGFRGPGYCVSAKLLQALHRRGYAYDASILPTFVGPLARFYYFLHSSMPPEERQLRSDMFGAFAHGQRPLSPYRWALPGAELLELPISASPVVRLPFHLSYILYLSWFSTTMARAYFNLALLACRATGAAPSLLFHLQDFLGCDEVRGLEFLPGMALTTEVKLQRVASYVDDFTRLFDAGPLGELAASLATRASSLPTYSLEPIKEPWP